MDGKPELIFPCERFLPSYIEAYEDDIKYRAGEEEILCPPDIVISQAKKYLARADLPDGYVPSSMLWMVDGREFLACVDIRHYLTDKLLMFGGHIGYEVRYGRYNRGYGTAALALALKHAKRELNINHALVTCNAENVASARVIEKNGGILENIVKNTRDDGTHFFTKRYWIET